MQTRAAAASAAMRANWHPDTFNNFREGLNSVFRQWTAIELAVYHQWGKI